MDEGTVTLKEHIEKILAEKDKTFDVIQQAAKEAVKVAYESASKRLEDHNNLLEKMKEQEKNFARADDVETLKTWKENSQGRLVIITWMVGIGVSILVGIAIALIVQWAEK